MVIGADYTMPFHEQLSVGLSLYNGYSWVYNVGCNANDPSDLYMGGQSAFGMSTPACPPTTNGAQQQPFFQAWGSEVHVNYLLPSVRGFQSSLSASFAPNGDAAIGYNSVTHGTGEAQYDPFYYRQDAEVFFGLNARY
jgi:hypothetical protein